MADDYTPLDHEVRNRAIIGGREIGLTDAEAEQQYDRWKTTTIRQAEFRSAEVALRDAADNLPTTGWFGPWLRDRADLIKHAARIANSGDQS